MVGVVGRVHVFILVLVVGLSSLPSLGSASSLVADDQRSERIAVLTVLPLDSQSFVAPAGVRASAELGDHMVLLRQVARNERFKGDLPLTASLSDVYVAHRRGLASPLDDHRSRLRILHETEGFTFFQTLPSTLRRLRREQGSHFRILPFEGKLRLRVLPERTSAAPVIDLEGSLHTEINLTRLVDDVAHLQDFETRYTYTDRFMDSARWVGERLGELGYDVRFEEYDDHGRFQVNVVARSFDEVTDGELILIGAHLDSISEIPWTLAPGADDNASGTAAVLELARVLAGTRYEPHLRFVLFGGEEVGLKGSRAHVNALEASGELARLRGVVILDMIGFDETPPLDVLFETRTFSDEFMAPFRGATEAIGTLAYRVSYSPWGSDHVPFLAKGVPCFLLIESEYAHNPNYHRSTDTLDAMNPRLMHAIVEATVLGIQAQVLEDLR